MIKEIIDEVTLDKKYEVYKEVEMNTPDGDIVTVLQLSKTISTDQLTQEISMIQSEIKNLQLQLIERQNVLEQINKLIK